MNHKVTKLTTKQNVFLTGVGQLGVQFDGKTKGVEMIAGDKGVMITKGPLVCFVPWGNVVCADGLVPIAQEQKSIKAVK